MSNSPEFNLPEVPTPPSSFSESLEDAIEATWAEAKLTETVALPQLPDEVDHIVAAWRRERPDLDVSAMTVFSRVARLARHFDLDRRSAFASHGLETWEFDVLSTLRRSGTPYALTPGALMTDLLVSSGTMTNRIDRLESKGLVSRSPSPLDRRAVLVQLTTEGRQRVDAAMAALLTKEEELLGDLAPEQRVELATLLRQLLLPFENHSN